MTALRDGLAKIAAGLRASRPVTHATALALIAAAMTLAAGAVHAQPYPSKPIRVIVPYPPGGTTDVVARLVGQQLTEAWGQPVTIENKSGGLGMIGTEAGARAPADGYTLTLGNNSTHAANAAMIERPPIDLRTDVQPIASAARTRHMLVVPTSSPFRSMKELVEAGRQRPLTYASSSAGSASHLISETLRLRNRMNATHVPYRGVAPAVVDVISGQVDFMTATVGGVAQHLQAGKLRALAVTGSTRLKGFADLPTFQEEGFEYLDADAWFAFYAPAGTPRPIVEKLSREITRIVGLPEVQDKLATAGFEPLAMGLEAFEAFHQRELVRWTEMVRTTGVKAAP
jgi:tripartite-type tricarboxylate transporter receptor subunit TctC